eukprot:1156268-Pelagomonas_calceolata.AAC.2
MLSAKECHLHMARLLNLGAAHLGAMPNSHHSHPVATRTHRRECAACQRFPPCVWRWRSWAGSTFSSVHACARASGK